MLEIQDLHVKFHSRDREAVSGVSLTIENGEILGLVGESGSGKSVTAMSVAGLLPRKQCDYSGKILLDGQELLHADRTALRKIQGADIGVVFQEPQSCMDPLMKIGPQVEETLRIHTQLSKEERHRRALAAMREGFYDGSLELGELAVTIHEVGKRLAGVVNRLNAFLVFASLDLRVAEISLADAGDGSRSVHDFVGKHTGQLLP